MTRWDEAFTPSASKRRIGVWRVITAAVLGVFIGWLGALGVVALLNRFWP